MSNQQNQNLREVDRALIQAVMFEHGILPMEKTDLDMRRALQQLPPEEARTLRRKFRKMWRKAMNATTLHGSSEKSSVSFMNDRTAAKLGLGKQVPSRSERNARKKLVYDQLWKTTIKPMIDSFELRTQVLTSPKKA